MALASAVTASTASVGAVAPRPAFRRDDGGLDVPIGGAVLLVLLVGLAFAAVWLRFGRTGSTPGAGLGLPGGWSALLARARGAAGDAPLRLVASRRLDGSARLHLLECEGRRYLIGCNGQHAIALVAALEGGSVVGALDGADR